MLINKRLKNIIKIQGILCLNILLVSHVQAEIFKCTNSEGAVYYNDKPCPLNNKEQKIKNEKDVVNGYVPKLKKQPSLGVAGKKNRAYPSLNSQQQGQKKQNSKKAQQNKQISTTNQESTNNYQGSKKANKQAASQLSAAVKPATNRDMTNQHSRALQTAAEKEELFIDLHAGETADFYKNN